MASRPPNDPRHRFRSEELITFIELRSFTASWDNLGLDTDDLLALQMAIICDPSAAPMISGTGGLRKLRFVPPRWSVGKRGALRVCYVYFEKYKQVLLSIVYAKSQQDDLSQDEKKRIKTVVERIEQELDRRSQR